MLLENTLINRQRSSSLSDSIPANLPRDENKKTPSSADVNVKEGMDYQITADNNWTEIGRKRQRNSPENLSRNLKQTKLNNYWLSTPVPISNRFENLETEDHPETDPSTNEKLTKPPPIFVDKVNNVQPLIKLLNDHVNNNYEIKVLRNDQVKILPRTSEAYTTIVKQLEFKETEFYTYKPKQERDFKVILKNLHSSMDTSEIIKALDELDHTVTNIWNIKSTRTKKSLPMFVVELLPKDNNKQIYEVRSLVHCRVTFEPPRPRRDIPQCANCQQYGHTKAYCWRKPKCIKCTGDHSSDKCARKGRSDNVKCVLCEGNHPANYKGCIVYQNLQKSRYPQLRRKHHMADQTKNPNTDTNTRINKLIPSQSIPSGTTYAQSVKDRQTNRDKPPQDIVSQPDNGPNEMKELMDMFKQIMQQMMTLTNLITTLTAKIS